MSAIHVFRRWDLLGDWLRTVKLIPAGNKGQGKCFFRSHRTEIQQIVCFPKCLSTWLLFKWLQCSKEYIIIISLQTLVVHILIFMQVPWTHHKRFILVEETGSKRRMGMRPWDNSQKLLQHCWEVLVICSFSNRNQNFPRKAGTSYGIISLLEDPNLHEKNSFDRANLTTFQSRYNSLS